MDDFQRTNLTAWLGPAADTLTPEQRARFEELVDAYDRDIVRARPGYGTDAYDERDYQDDTDAAWTAALEIADGTIDLVQTGRDYDAAKTRAKQAAIMAVISGESEAKAAQLTRFSRPALRKALGK